MNPTTDPLADTPLQLPADGLSWILIAVGAGLYVLTCVHMALYARRTGRRPVRWFFLTLFFTAIPVAIYFYIRYFLQVRHAQSGPPPAERQGMTRCPHCRRLFPADQPRSPGGGLRCPHCGMNLDDEVHLA